MSGMTRIQWALLVSLAAAPASAQPATSTAAPSHAACPTIDAALPADLAPWTSARPLAAARSTVDLASARLTPGDTVLLALAASGEVGYAVPPSKPEAASSHAGLAGFTIADAGTYRIALSSGGWIDLTREGKALASTGHSHGPACSSIHKIVEFSLQPGPYVLQISGNAEPQVRVLITR